jgi:hypothetical protein
VFAEIGKKLRAKVLLLAHEYVIILLRENQAIVIRHTAVDLRYLTEKNLCATDNALADDRLVLREYQFKETIVVGRDDRMRLDALQSCDFRLNRLVGNS